MAGLVVALALTLCAQVAPPGGGTSAGTFGTVVSLGGTPSDVVLDESRGRLYLVNNSAARVDIYDYRAKQITGAFQVGSFPLAAAMSMDRKFLYVTNTQSSTLSVIDLDINSVLQNISLPARPEGVAVGLDGRVLVTTQGTGQNNQFNTLLVVDRSQAQLQQVFPVQFPPPINTPNPLPQLFVGRPSTPFPGRLIRTPDGQFIIGMVAINQTASSAQTTLFVYEAASGTVLQNRTVTGQSTVLAMAPDGSRIMAGSTLYDTVTLAVIGQMNTANLPFFVQTGSNPNFNIQSNYGGSVFTPDGETLYSAFNTAGNNQRPLANVLYIADSYNLGVRLGIRLPESILGQMAVTSDGNEVFALSESGLIDLPMSQLLEYPILMPETTTAFMSIDLCNKGLAKAQVRVTNLGNGKVTFSVPSVTPALVTDVSTGVVPATITFTMEPGRSNVTRLPGTNLFSRVAGGNGNPINVTLSSPEAINFPNIIQVFMNYREPDQRGVIYPLPQGLNNTERLQQLLLDEPRGKLYITNAGYNRIEVFDLKKERFVEPMEAGQLPHAMAMSLDGSMLYVGNTGGESITMTDLDTGKIVGEVDFPPIPRAGNQNALKPVAMAMGFSGLQFIMAPSATQNNAQGTFWKLLGNQALPRPANAVTPSTIPGPHYMTSTPDGDYIVAMAGNADSYLYNSLYDSFTASRRLYNQTPTGFFGPLGASGSGAFYLANGLVLSPSLAVIGGAERAGAVQVRPPAQPGQPAQTTVVSAGQRNVAAVAALSETSFIRLTTPVRQNINAQTRDDPRPIIEMVDVNSGAETVVAVAPDTPTRNVFGTQRTNIPSRQLVVDSKGTGYALTLSGLSVIPLALSGVPNRPIIIGGSRGIVNSADGSTNLQPGSFITVTGQTLAKPATADTTPAPTLLGGSCVTFSDVPAPLLQTSGSQIFAQVPDTLRPGLYVFQVRSLANAQVSDPVVIRIQSPPSQ